jgi:two-component system response regulator YesN
MKAVLIVDDNEFIHEVLKENILCHFEVVIHDAYSSAEGIECLQAKRIDLIICDFEMPEESGIAVLQFIERYNIDVEIIFFTGLSRIDDLEDRHDIQVIFDKNFSLLHEQLKHSFLKSV